MKEKMVGLVEERLTDLYTELQGGGNPSPAARFRLEGILEAAETAAGLSKEELYAIVDGVFRKIYQQSLNQVFGQDWMDQYAFPSLPICGIRAPVYPGKKID